MYLLAHSGIGLWASQGARSVHYVPGQEPGFFLSNKASKYILEYFQEEI